MESPTLYVNKLTWPGNVIQVCKITHKDYFVQGLRFGAAAYKKGQREGSIVVYEADKYPCGAIGPVQFMWKPHVDDRVRYLYD